MSFIPVRTVAPTATPVDLDQAKAQLRVDTNDEDDLIVGLIEAATAHLDGWAGILGRALVTQTWTQGFGCFDDTLRLPLAPVQSVVVKYFDGDNAEQTWSSGNYALFADEIGPYVAPLSSVSFPTIYDRADPVTVTLVCGYGSPSAVPPALKNAILLAVGHWYRNREAVGEGSYAELPLAFQSLIAPYRRIGV